MAEIMSSPPLALSTRFSSRADVDRESGGIDAVETHPRAVGRDREGLSAVAAVDFGGVLAGTTFH